LLRGRSAYYVGTNIVMQTVLSSNTLVHVRSIFRRILKEEFTYFKIVYIVGSTLYMLRYYLL